MRSGVALSARCASSTSASASRCAAERKRPRHRWPAVARPADSTPLGRSRRPPDPAIRSAPHRHRGRLSAGVAGFRDEEPGVAGRPGQGRPGSTCPTPPTARHPGCGPGGPVRPPPAPAAQCRDAPASAPVPSGSPRHRRHLAWSATAAAVCGSRGPTGAPPSPRLGRTSPAASIRDRASVRGTRAMARTSSTVVP